MNKYVSGINNCYRGKIQQVKEKTVAISHRITWECPTSRVTFTQKFKGTR